MMFSSSSNPSSTSVHLVSPFQPYFPISPSSYNHPPPPPPPCAHLDSVTGDISPHHFHDQHLFSTQFPLHNNSNNALTAAPPPPHHHHQTLITQLGVSSNTVPPTINASFSGEDHHQYYHHNFYGNIHNNISNFPYFPLHSSSKEDLDVPVAVKKDRHSKIFTAQGLRDRRVRLSINVARQFFDLQDLLGFDKASKTLEWLLTKSKKAIKQLGPHTKHLSTSSSTTSSSGRPKSSCSGSEVEAEPASAAVDHVVVANKETRAKARARARERTKEKLMLNKVQLKVVNASEASISSSHQELGSLLSGGVNKGNKLKQISSVNYYSNNYNSQQNWDMNGGFSCPSLNGI